MFERLPLDARFRSTKAAVKRHTLLDLRGNIPTFIHISDGKMHEVNVLDILIPETGSFYIMDRGLLDFSRLYCVHQASVFFVFRAKSNLANDYIDIFLSPIETKKISIQSIKWFQ